MTKLILIRHGMTDDNLLHCLSGITDHPLNEVGLLQAEYTAKVLHTRTLSGEQVTALYASPLLRTAKTAEVIGSLLGLPVEFHEDLIEMNMGIYEGLSVMELTDLQKQSIESAMQPGDEEFAWEGGESRQDIYRRIESVLRTLAGNHPDETVIIVTHGGVISYFLAGIAGKPLSYWNDFYVANCSLSYVYYENGTFSIDGFNHADHVARDRYEDLYVTAKERLGIGK